MYLIERLILAEITGVFAAALDSARPQIGGIDLVTGVTQLAVN